MLSKLKKTLVLFLGILLILSFSLTALAEDTAVDFDKSGSVSVTLKSSAGDHKVLYGASFMLYHVAVAYDNNSNLGYNFTAEFAACGAGLADLQAEGLAEHLLAYAQAQKLQPVIVKADANGTATFSDLKPGLYLIAQDGRVSGYYPITPFVVSVPMTDPAGENWIYDVDASPKVEHKPSIPPIDPENPDNPDNTKMTVKKVWHGRAAGEAIDSVSVSLLRDGKIYETVELNSQNNWRYTWSKLDNDHRWSIAEIDVPNGYEVSYDSNGSTVTITNTFVPKIPVETESLTVKKLWANDAQKDRPDFVTIELWNKNEPYAAVALSAHNNWTYTWSDLPKSPDWQIREVNIPSGYQASYEINGTTVTVTNTYRPTESIPPTPTDSNNSAEPPLLQTGQLNWPVSLLAALGLVLFMAGWFLRFSPGKKRP